MFDLQAVKQPQLCAYRPQQIKDLKINSSVIKNKKFHLLQNEDVQVGLEKTHHGKIQNYGVFDNTKQEYSISEQ